MRLRVDGFRARLTAGEALRVIRQRVETNLLLTPHAVQEKIRGDPVQPALKSAGRVIGQGPKHAHEDILGEVLGIMRVPGKPVSEPIHPITVIPYDLFPGGRHPRGLVSTGDFHRGGLGDGIAVRHRT